MNTLIYNTSKEQKAGARETTQPLRALAVQPCEFKFAAPKSKSWIWSWRNDSAVKIMDSFSKGPEFGS